MTISPLKVPYLRAQRDFPDKDMKTLAVEIDRAYIDIADKVNTRTIGIFPVSFQVVTGESWFLQGSNQKQQTQRKVFTFTSTSAIDLGFDTANIQYFTAMYGQCKKGSDWFGLIPGTNVAIAGEISFYISGTPTNQITFLNGAGAPTLDYGMIVLEWMNFQ